MRVFLVAALPLAVLTGCGGGHRSTTVTHAVTRRKVCEANIFFSKRATHAQERAVGAKLREDPHAEQIVFISKAQALAEMPKQYRKVAKQLHLGNPLPDSFRVVPVSPSDTRQIGASVAHAPGIRTVKLIPCARLR